MLYIRVYTACATVPGNQTKTRENDKTVLTSPLPQEGTKKGCKGTRKNDKETRKKGKKENAGRVHSQNSWDRIASFLVLCVVSQTYAYIQENLVKYVAKRKERRNVGGGH